MSTPMILLFALIAAGGAALTVNALAPRRARVQLLQADDRPLADRLLTTFFVPAAQRLARIGRRDMQAQQTDLAARLAQAAYPPPFTSPENVLGYQLLTAAIFAGMVGLFGLVLSLLVGAGALGFVLPLALGVGALGFVMPQKTINNAIAQRQEQLTLDAASTLDRLAIYVAAGYALPVSLRDLAQRPGGAWIAEMRQIAGEYAVTGDFPAALDHAGERNGRLPEIVRVTERLKAAYEMGGGGIAQTLRRMSQDARIRIRLILTERGYKNAVMMVIPAFFAIIAIALILIAPGAVQMMQVLGG